MEFNQYLAFVRKEKLKTNVIVSLPLNMDFR